MKIRLLGLEKFLSPKAPAHILWLKCAAYLSLINPLEAAQLWGKVRPGQFFGAPEVWLGSASPDWALKPHESLAVDRKRFPSVSQKIVLRDFCRRTRFPFFPWLGY